MSSKTGDKSQKSQLKPSGSKTGLSKAGEATPTKKNKPPNTENVTGTKNSGRKSSNTRGGGDEKKVSGKSKSKSPNKDGDQ